MNLPSKRIDQQRHLDNLHTSAWIHQMSAVWGHYRVASVLEVGTVTGWFFLLFEYGKCELSFILLGFSSTLLYMMIFAIHREEQKLLAFAKALISSRVMPRHKKPKPLFVFGGRFSAHEYAWLIPMFLIIVNTLLACYAIERFRVFPLDNLFTADHLLIKVIMGWHILLLFVLFSLFLFKRLLKHIKKSWRKMKTKFFLTKT
jgi:hypothetical protein